MHDSIPEYTWQRGCISILIFAILWQIEFYICRYLFASNPSNKILKELSTKDKIYYASYYHGINHSIVSTVGAMYCFIYADGQAGTTWFSCAKYQLTMYPVQQYLNTLTIGYLVQDLIFCL